MSNTDMVHMNTEEVTMMGSREIAYVTDKRHADVLRDIRSMASSLYDGADLRYLEIQGLTVVVDEFTKRTSEVYLDRTHAETLVTGYDVKRRMAVIQRWMQLEEQHKPQLPDFSNPAEAARAWADQFEGREKAEALALEHQKKIEEDAPKVEYYEKVGDSTGLMTLSEAIKSMNIDLGRNKAIAQLRSMGVLQSSKTYWNQPYQQYINQGYFVMKQKTLPNGAIASVTLVTPKGHQWLYKKLTN